MTVPLPARSLHLQFALIVLCTHSIHHFRLTLQMEPSTPFHPRRARRTREEIRRAKAKVQLFFF